MTRTKFQPKHSGCVLSPTVLCSPVVFWLLSRKSIMHSALSIPPAHTAFLPRLRAPLVWIWF